MAEEYRAVRALDPRVARKIAAGEVIDRPAAIIREVLDNAVDAGAQSITVEIAGGGIDSVRIVDDGYGMTKEDLETCARPHTTSKITTEDDLLRLSTLGFRGEALASIAAVCRLEITSVREGSPAWKLDAELTQAPAGQPDSSEQTAETLSAETVRQGTTHRVSPARLVKGTIVQAAGLFENFPARRLFLKRPASETQLCQQTVIEKALPRPDIAFRFTADGKQKFALRGGVTLLDRCVAALSPSEPETFFKKQDGNGEGFSFSVILGTPEVVRSDRRNLMVFINGRRIWEYSLIQALEYGAQGFFPNGTHPFACLFLHIDPSLIDFNIHPAKKEARFKDIGPVHKAVSSAVRSFYHGLAVSSLVKEASPAGGSANNGGGSGYTGYRANGETGQTKSGARELFDERDTVSSPRTAYSSGGPSFTHGSSPAARGGSVQGDSSWSRGTGQKLDRRESPYEAYARLTGKIPAPGEESGADGIAAGEADGEQARTADELRFRYLGQALGVFLAAEKDGAFYLVDQHAAHERILFERIMESGGRSQKLLIPYVVETESGDDDAYLEGIRTELETAGFSMKNEGDGSWSVSAVPERWTGTEEELAEDILTLRTAPGELIYSLAASAACRAAVKDGDVLDADTAKTLLCEAFSLKDPHCPHGRPIWTVLSRDELFARVRRTR